MPEAEDDKKTEAPAPRPVDVRFRTFAADGRQVASVAVKVARAAPLPHLFAPYFGHALYQPGDKAFIVVRADGVKQADVKLIVEKQSGGDWQAAAELPAAIAM